MALRLIAQIILICLLIMACTFLPFLPGRYDALAVTLSTMSQVFGMVGLLFTPIGVLWLVYELRKRKPEDQALRKKDKGYRYAITSVVILSLSALIVSLAAFVNGFSIGFITLALWTFIASRVMAGLKRMKNAEVGPINLMPLYLIVVPAVAAVTQFTLVGPATEFSRSYAIEKCTRLIDDLEEFHRSHGKYPSSLQSLWEDYGPLVTGIERFHYEPHGDAYNISFEQFRLYPLGTREIVVYNKLDEHAVFSHNTDRLTWEGEALRVRQGYFAVHDLRNPHWKAFWFD